LNARHVTVGAIQNLVVPLDAVSRPVMGVSLFQK